MYTNRQIEYFSFPCKTRISYVKVELHLLDCSPNVSVTNQIFRSPTKNSARLLPSLFQQTRNDDQSLSRSSSSIVFETLATECAQLNIHASVRAENKYAWTRRITARNRRDIDTGNTSSNSLSLSLSALASSAAMTPVIRSPRFASLPFVYFFPSQERVIARNTSSLQHVQEFVDLGSPFRLPISKSYAWRFKDHFYSVFKFLSRSSPRPLSFFPSKLNEAEIQQSVKLTLPNLLNCSIISFLEDRKIYRDNYGY